MDMGRTVYFARVEKCLKLTQNGITEIEVLQTDHEEADSKISYLSQHAATGNDTNEICVRSSSGDIDIPVILTGTLGGIETRLLVDNGTGKSRKTILINNFISSVQQQQALIGFHAFTGNDYVSSFLRKTKKLWQTLVKDDEEMLEFFVALGVEQLTDDLHLQAERVVCRMYGEKKVDLVNELRSKMFWNRLKNGKVIDLALLPPCSSSLRKHTIRASYISKMWKNATEPLQALDSFANNGWLEDGSIDWIDCMYPDNLESIFSPSSNSADPTPEEDCSEEIDYAELSDIEDED